MYCIKCGTELPADALFCKNCGNRINPASDMNANKVTPAIQQVSRAASAPSDAAQKPEETSVIKAVNPEPRTAVIVFGAVIAFVVLILLITQSGANRLVGTWEKTSGEFQLWGYWEDHDSYEGKSGELVFKSKDFYIVTDGDGYVYSDSYKVVDDGHLIMLCDGEKNTYQYSISGNTLIIECQYGEISYWTRR